MMKMTVDPKKCPQNHRCPAIAVCPQAAISQQDNHALPIVDPDKCIFCEKCIKFCPMGAFKPAP